MEARIKEDIPIALDCLINMECPNQTINIYSGPFTLAALKITKAEYKFNGEFEYVWFPHRGVRFKGIGGPTPKYLDRVLDLKIDGLKVGDGCLTGNTGLTNYTANGFVKGKIVIGDVSIPVEKICFSVPNLRNLQGSILINKKIEGGQQKSLSRFIFETKDYKIVFDKLSNYNILEKNLKTQGGYLNLYCGELEKKNKAITFEEASEILDCFGNFLTFLNGSRTSVTFRSGVFEKKTVWTDFSNYPIDMYKQVYSWTPHWTIDEINKIWSNFYGLSVKSDSNKNFLKSVVHWYIEANNLTGNLEGSIIMAQAGLELLYNWLVIEQKKILMGADADKISASNKIRLLLSELKCEKKVPISLENLNTFVGKSKDITDGPEAFVTIRNGIVHSNEEKRRRISELDDEIKKEALELGILYIELSMLYILQYDGTYMDRCSKKATKVPWKS